MKEQEGNNPDLTEMTRTYANISHEASITFGEKGEVVKKERDQIYRQIVDLTAIRLVENPDMNVQAMLTDTVMDMSFQRAGMGLVLEFTADVAGKLARIASEERAKNS